MAIVLACGLWRENRPALTGSFRSPCAGNLAFDKNQDKNGAPGSPAPT
jgi:hypothetical protein